MRNVTPKRELFGLFAALVNATAYNPVSAASNHRHAAEATPETTNVNKTFYAVIISKTTFQRW
jgi:hypothetical protein